MSKTLRLVIIFGSVLVVLAVVTLGVLAWRQGRPRPTVTARDLPHVLGASPSTVTLAIESPSGLVATVDVRVTQAGESKQVSLGEPLPGASPVDSIPLDAAALGLTEGEAELSVFVADDAWRPKPDPTPQLVHRFTVDLTPPTLQFVSATRYVKHAGSAVVVYRVEGASASGVRVGEATFPGHAGLSRDVAVRVALFALPHAQAPSQPSIWARDDADNLRNLAFSVEFLPTKFGDDEVKLSEKFLQRKVPELDPQTPGTATVEELLERFLTVNRDGRRASEETIRQAASGSGEAAPLWQGAFRQQPGTQVFAGFPEERTYSMDGKRVDQQWHLGLDLASNKRSVVEAAGAGRVVYTGSNGIYGNMVVLDHGLGLHSLYAHLSVMSVKVGDRVARGGPLGRSGETGLAGGDHIHFAMLVHGTYVNPVEWWDAAWIRDRFARPLVEAGISVPGITDGVSAADEPPARARRAVKQGRPKSSRTRRRR